MAGLPRAGLAQNAAQNTTQNATQNGAQDAGTVDWLSNAVSVPVAMPLSEAPVTDSAAIETITVAPLDAPTPDGVGLLSQAQTGLPANLWRGSSALRIADEIAHFPATPLPAVQDQFRKILMAELNPAEDSGPEGFLFQARIDGLLTRGALDEADALMQRAQLENPELFRRAFDIALLTGRETEGCEALRDRPGISLSFPVRIFCLARNGDWPAAALTLETAEALGQLSPYDDNLLAIFLDPDLADQLPPLPPPARPTPLIFRMLEAIGEPLPTARQPLAFAHADLRPNAGWMARLRAAERLARAGSLSGTKLFDIYREGRPAASGELWDRVKAYQKFETALRAKDPSAIADTLPPIWASMSKAGLATLFAQSYGPALAEIPLTGRTADLAFHIGLLSDAYETIALIRSPTQQSDRFLAGLARGIPDPALANSQLTRVIAAAFADTPPSLPAAIAFPDNEGKMGEAMLAALRMIAEGAHTDPKNITSALAYLRQIGMEDVARRAGLQMLLLDPHA